MASQRFQTLDEWLDWQAELHPSLIELGLERVNTVFQTLYPDTQAPFTVITVAGTNGKGSSIALLQSVLLAAGYRVGTYTSPHLLRYNERILINGEQASDKAIMDAFQRIDQARSETSLTYFEFGTLAALDIFYQTPLDVVLLEVGLGGRLDAVNIIDSDIALITSIGLDHTDWLGPDRESIGREKAGIMRPAKPVVCSDPLPPSSIALYGAEIGAQLYQLGSEFKCEAEAEQLAWQSASQKLALPLPKLRGIHQLNNTAGVLMVLELLQSKLPVSRQQLRQGILGLQPPAGRQQICSEPVSMILDVAHNEDSVRALAELLQARGCEGQTLAVLGMLADKDLPAIIRVIEPLIDHWYLADINQPRGAQATHLATVIAEINPTAKMECFADVDQAWRAASRAMTPSDRMVVFGSFYTVADVLAQSV